MRSSFRSARRRFPELGNASGFTFRLQDRSGAGHDALLAARNQLLGMAGQSKILTQVRPDGLEDAPQLQIVIDREKANALGVTFDSINTALSTALGSSYVNDFPNQGRLQRVVVQADAPARMQPDDLLKINASNSQGQPVPMSAFATTKWITGAMQTVRYNGYPAMRIGGAAAPGYSTGAAMTEMENLAKQLPAGFGFEWTGQSREEKLAGSQATILYGFAILAVFLCLAALYESWSIPLAVILVVPLGVMGVLLGTLFRGYSNDVYFQVGLITIIGLSAKNAILIIEFAKDLQAQGKSVIESALAAAPPALPPHRDDLAGLHAGCDATGDRIWRQLGQPARHRHGRDQRNDHWHGAGGIFCTRLFCGDSRLLQGQRTATPEVCRARESGRYQFWRRRT